MKRFYSYQRESVHRETRTIGDRINFLNYYSDHRLFIRRRYVGDANA